MTAVPSRMEAALREILQGSDNVTIKDVTRGIRTRGLLNTNDDKEELKSTLGRMVRLRGGPSRETTVHLIQRPDPLIDLTNEASPQRPLQLPPRRLRLPRAPRHPEIVRLAGDLQLSDAVKDTACNLWHAAPGKFRRPRSRNVPPQAAFLTCLYIACLLEECPRTISEILHYTRDSAPNITDQQIFRCYKLMKDAIAGLRSEIKPYTAECFTDRWCTELGLAAIPGFSDSVRELLTNLRSLRTEEYISEGKVESVGSAAILMCLNNWPRLRELPQVDDWVQRVSSHCHVTKQTTMKHYRVYMRLHANHQILPACCM